MRNKTAVFALLCLVALLALSACGQKPSVSESTPDATPPGTSPVASSGPASAPAGAPAEASLRGVKLVEVVAPKNFRDVEFETPYDVLTKAGALITVVSTKKGEVVGADGLKVQAVAKPKDIKVAEYTGVIFIGGPGMMDYLNDASFVALAKAFASAGKLTAAICVAPAILANAGLLDGKAATAFPDVVPVLKAKGAHVVTDDVAVAGKIITANGPPAAADFAQALLKALSAQPGKAPASQPLSTPAKH